MYPDLSKIFGRDFVIGFFLPAVIFASVQIVVVLLVFTDYQQLFRDSDVPEVVRHRATAAGAQPNKPIEPLNGRVVVRWREPSVTAQQHPLPKADPSAKKEDRKELKSGTVVSIADAHVLETGERAASNIRPGETVYFFASEGNAFRQANGDVISVVDESDILAHEPSQTPLPDLPPTLSQLLSTKFVVGLLLAALVLGILLMAINRELYRFCEGYGEWNPLRLLGCLERQSFNCLKTEIKKLNDNYNNLSLEQLKKLAGLMVKMAKHFPDEPWLLPTRFGNINRAFEVYSRIMYGLDAIPGWERLEAVCSRESKEATIVKKSQVDFWFNSCVLTLVLAIECVWIAWSDLASWWLPIVILAIAWFLMQRAKAATILWGESIKALIDVGVPILMQKLEFAGDGNLARERQIWESYTHAILFRRSDRFPARAEPKQLNAIGVPPFPLPVATTDPEEEATE
jgi:co-chaperonin GroES (HSP10)